LREEEGVQRGWSGTGGWKTQGKPTGATVKTGPILSVFQGRMGKCARCARLVPLSPRFFSSAPRTLALEKSPLAREEKRKRRKAL